MIEIKALNKSYGPSQVLKDINLNLSEGKVYGLLGRNGVGKTTLLNIMANLIKADSGQVLFNGENVYENAKALGKIAIIKESGFGIQDIKVKEIFAAAKFLCQNWDDDYANSLIKEFALNTKKNYSKLSRGNQTLVGLIIGLASRAPLSLFDEPSLGLDPAVRYRFYNLLLEDLQENPRTIIISTHLIDEVTNLFEEIIILKNKEIYLKDEVEKIMAKAYFLNGRLEKMTPVLKNKNVINQEAFGSSTIVSLFDNLTKREKQALRESGVEISPIPLQKLFILLTENGEGESQWKA